MDKNELLNGLSDALFGVVFMAVLWYLLIGLLYVIGFVYAICYAALKTLVLPLLRVISVSVWRFIVIRFSKSHSQHP